MKIKIDHEETAPGEGRFIVILGENQPWSQSQQFPYDANYSKERALGEAEAFYAGAYAMFNVTKSQMLLDVDGRDIFRKEHNSLKNR